MRRMSEPKPVLSVRIDDEILRRLDQLSERTGISRAEIVERCLAVGIVDEEEYVKSLESAITGPLMQMFMRPRVMKMVLDLLGEKVDETQMKVAENIRKKKGSRDRVGKLAH